MPKTDLPNAPFVTFPLRVDRDLWQCFKDSLEPGETAYGVLLQFVMERAAVAKPKRKTGQAK